MVVEECMIISFSACMNLYRLPATYVPEMHSKVNAGKPRNVQLSPLVILIFNPNDAL